MWKVEDGWMDGCGAALIDGGDIVVVLVVVVVVVGAHLRGETEVVV